MDEVEYVVPPESGAPKVSNNQVKPPKKPSKFLAWISANKAVSVAGLIMAIIVVIAGTAMITGQKISIFGLQLNPLYQQANCPVDPVTGMEQTSCGGLWDQPGVETDKITISGTFSEGNAGVEYNKELQLSGTVQYPCVWSLVSVNPAITGAAIKLATSADTNSSKATFSATPTAPGKYQVNVKATCQSGQTATKAFAWVVGGATTSRELDISANFTDALVGQPYTTTVTTVNANSSTCNLSIVSITPKLDGAALNRVENIVAGSDTSALFTVNSQASGIYVVKISADCSDATGAKRTVQKDFNFTIKPTKQSPVGAALDISASFADGKVGQASTFTVKTINSESPLCTWNLDKVTPNMSGAKIVAAGADPDSDRDGRATFTATPSAAGTYVVSIAVQCGEANGDKKTAKKDVTWKVTVGGTTGGGGSGGGGSSASNCSSNKDKLMPIYRFWKAADGDHFFTTNAGERPGDYVYEGIAGYVYSEKVSGSTAVYRSYHSGLRAHYYSTTDDATNYGYANEGILGYAFSNNATGALPWFRLHKGYPQSDYLETTHTGEKAAAMAMGYLDEGIVVNVCEKNS